MPNWLRDAKGEQVRWAGGPVAVTDDGRKTYYLDRRIGGRHYALSLGSQVRDDNAALSELALFDTDPPGYLPRHKRQAAVANAKDEANAATRAGAVVIDAATLDGIEKALSKGYGNRDARTPLHVADSIRYVGEWGTGPLAGRDLRVPYTTLRDLQDGLATWRNKDGVIPAEQKRISSLKAFTAWLRFRGSLSSQTDPTADLICLQARKPTEAEKEAKIYDPDTLAAHYRRMDRQWWRDVFVARVKLGMHLSEIIKFMASGKLSATPDAGEIAGVVQFGHKNRRTHRQCVDAQAFAALERLKRLKKLPSRGKAQTCMERAADSVREGLDKKAAAQVERLLIANLRHTFVTLARKRGRVVYLPDEGGVSADIVARVAGHAEKTADTFYAGGVVEPLIVIPVKLWHPDDPVQTANRRHLRAVS